MYDFSRQLVQSSPVNTISQAIEKLKSANLSYFDLTETNPTIALSDYPHAAITQAFCKSFDSIYRPEATGTAGARQQIAQQYARRGVTIGTDRIFLTASTSEAYSHLFNLLCNPGEAVLAPSPSYPLFEYLAALSSIEVKPYRILYDGSWHIDFQTLRSQICPRTKAIVVVNPNNPTGHFLSSWELKTLLQVAADFNLPLISDEVFLEYSLNAQDALTLSLSAEESVPSFVLGGLSKAAGMPQMKMAWTIVNGPAEFRTAAMKPLELMLDTYLSVNTPVQNALTDLLQIGGAIRESIKRQTRQNWTVLQQALDGTAANPLHLEGGWSAIIRVPAIWEEETWVLKLMQECRTIVQPGFYFDMNGGPHLVVSLLTKPDVFKQGMEGIQYLLAGHD